MTSSTAAARLEREQLPEEIIPLNPGHHCQPAQARGLYWNWTRAGEAAIQPCPPGTQGFARWRCGPHTATWQLDTPDLGECEAHWVGRLDSRLRGGEAVGKVASELAAVTESRPLYGGDLVRVSQLLAALASRLRQEVRRLAEPEARESLVTSLLQSVQRTASSLLEDRQEEAWTDLRPPQRAAAGTALLLGIQEAAHLVADTVTGEQNLVEVTGNLVSSVRVLEATEAAAQTFPSLASLPLAAEARLVVPGAAVRGLGPGTVRLVLLLYSRLDTVLPSSSDGVKFLNSAVVAASSPGHRGPVSPPLQLTLRHTHTGGVARPSCCWWDAAARRWAEEGCSVAASNTTHTQCSCAQLGHIAVLMEETAAPGPEVARPPPAARAPEAAAEVSLATVVGCVAAVVAGVLVAVLGFFLLRRLNLKTGLHKFLTTGRLPCLQCREGKGGLYPAINSSPTSTTLSSGTPTASTSVSSNYFLNAECQLQEPVVLSPPGNTATIYRATLANGQQVPVIPVSHLQLAASDPRSQYFRPVSPLGHIYMEIDPVYARLEDTAHPHHDHQLSDVSDDDVRRSSDISRQSSNRYAEERPLIRSTLRRSAPHARNTAHAATSAAVRTVSACTPGSSLRLGGGAGRARPPVTSSLQHPGFRSLDTPITIALSPGGEQFVSMNLDQQQQQQQQLYQQQQQPPQRGHHHHPY